VEDGAFGARTALFAPEAKIPFGLRVSVPGMSSLPTMPALSNPAPPLLHGSSNHDDLAANGAAMAFSLHTALITGKITLENRESGNIGLKWSAPPVWHLNHDHLGLFTGRWGFYFFHPMLTTSHILIVLWSYFCRASPD
jgi:hypothetical protein